jgi:hypothetical protein
MPPPSSGGIAVAQMLGMFETRDMALAPIDGVPGAEAVHLFSEVGRLAYADRDRYAADTDFVPLPGRGMPALIDKAYLAKRASLIGRTLDGRGPGRQSARHGRGLGPGQFDRGPFDLAPGGGRWHGAGLSMTTTVEDAFGSRQMVDGFILNNQLTDFSFDSRDAGGPIANRVEPGKRPRSAMSPDHRVRQENRQAGAGGRLAGRPGHHQLRGQGAGRHPRLGPERAAGDRAAEFRQPQRADRTGSGAFPAATDRRAEGARPHVRQRRTELRPARHRAHADPRRAAGGSAAPIRAAKVWQKAIKTIAKGNIYSTQVNFVCYSL